MGIFIGTAGFFYKDWEGIVYPPDLKKREGPSAGISGAIYRLLRD
jgi:uncharacterized protein YecE (DUF72 family)